MRINRASDDAAGLAISSSLKADSRVFTQAIRNVNDGFSVLSIAQGALSELSGISTRQLELAEQAANGSYSLVQRRSLNAEANALVDEFNRIVASVDFNGRKLLDKSLDGLRIQAGYGLDGSIAFGLGDELARNVGDGTFQAGMNVGTGFLPYAVSLGDFNGDGLLDLVSADISSSTLSVMLGNGDGTFQTRKSFATGTSPYSVTLGDFNGDGLLDLVSSDSSSSTLSVMLGNGDGTFLARRSFGTGSTPQSVILGDFNGDGLLDLVSADQGSNTLSVMLSKDPQTTESQFLNLNTRQGALDAMSVIDATLRRISSELGAIGSTQSRLGVALDNLAVSRENFDAAAGRIQDADVAAESADLVRTGILQQAAAAVLAQANQQPALAIQLLRG